MIPSEKKSIKKISKALGYFFSFMLFTIILFFIFKLTNKLPEGWRYFSFFLVGMSIALIGTILKMTVK